MIKSPELLAFVNKTKEFIKDNFEGYSKNINELYMIHQDDADGKIGLGRMLIGTNVKNLLAESKNEIFRKEIIPTLAKKMVEEEKRLIGVCWQKLVVKKEGDKSIRGLCIVFETIEGIEVHCIELIEGEEGKFSFGEELELKDISFANKFKLLLTNGEKKYTTDEFEEFIVKDNGEFKVKGKNNALKLRNFFNN